MEHIVIDTNVIVTALMSRQGASFRLVSEFETGKFTFHLSVPLVLEYEDACKRQIGTRILLTSEDIDDFIDYLCFIGKQHQVYYLWRPYLRDPRDDMILELAVKANCRWIITYNLVDFRDIERFHLQAAPPLAFLRHLGVLS